LEVPDLPDLKDLQDLLELLVQMDHQDFKVPPDHADPREILVAVEMLENPQTQFYSSIIQEGPLLQLEAMSLSNHLTCPPLLSRGLPFNSSASLVPKEPLLEPHSVFASQIQLEDLLQSHSPQLGMLENWKLESGKILRLEN